MGCGNSRKLPPAPETCEKGVDLGLSDRQIQMVKDSWSLIQVDMLAIGLDIFSIFFKREDNETLRLFPKVIQNEGNGGSMKIHEGNLQYHVMLVMKGIGKAVENLDYPSSLISYLNYLGRRHLQHNVKPYLLECLWPAIDEGFASVLTDVYTEELRTAWKMFIDMMVTRMQSVMTESRDVTSQQNVVKSFQKSSSLSQDNSEQTQNGQVKRSNGSSKH
ncbi:hypothetical protein FSP39_014242 [Pinctada imbricata]|uniref:Globin domain-containing protein n=1 Tax=Pinctada imbricata TaxID=66713 RepID=A0AA89BWE1_PINIB|nr:hypothetical protein FSP39_014242 [Pinctada imbricata]